MANPVRLAIFFSTGLICKLGYAMYMDNIALPPWKVTIRIGEKPPKKEPAPYFLNVKLSGRCHVCKEHIGVGFAYQMPMIKYVYHLRCLPHEKEVKKSA